MSVLFALGAAVGVALGSRALLTCAALERMSVTRLNAALEGRYHIESELGEGGIRL